MAAVVGGGKVRLLGRGSGFCKPTQASKKAMLVNWLLFVVLIALTCNGQQLLSRRG